MRANHQLALRPRKKVNDQTKWPREKNEQHPKNRAIHSAIFCVSGNPYQQSNVKDDKPNQEQERKSTTC